MSKTSKKNISVFLSPHLLKRAFLGNAFPFRLKSKGSTKMYTAVFIVFSFLMTSCSSTKQTTYFKDIPRDTLLTNLIAKNTEPVIQSGDLLSIMVSSLSPENTTIYNAPQNIVGAQNGYLVEDNGSIQFVKLGIIQVAGLSRKDLKIKLEKELLPYLAQPIVAVGILNRHVTLMGAVSPQVLPLTGDHMTILDALASSGDIGEKGKKENILVIREKENGKEFKRLNLTDKSIFYSPYFYLHPNDVIYVEPVKEKNNKVPQILSYITAGISFLILIIDRIIK